MTPQERAQAKRDRRKHTRLYNASHGGWVGIFDQNRYGAPCVECGYFQRSLSQLRHLPDCRWQMETLN